MTKPVSCGGVSFIPSFTAKGSFVTKTPDRRTYGCGYQHTNTYSLPDVQSKLKYVKGTPRTHHSLHTGSRKLVHSSCSVQGNIVLTNLARVVDDPVST
jgi:hypothetical protein